MKEEKIKIAAVSYLNTLPFIYGLQNYQGFSSNFEMHLMPPAECAKAYKNGDVDISLMPVGAMTEEDVRSICCSYCLGADGDVKSVLLLSDTPLDKIKTIYLDPESRTSVLLVQVLAANYWKISPEFVPAARDQQIGDGEGIVLIGDKTFNIENKYSHITDLSTVWKEFTGLPFVFAAWVSRIQMPADRKAEFNSALEWGLKEYKQSIPSNGFSDLSPSQVIDYLENCISYTLDESKRRGMSKFLALCEAL